MFYTILFRRGSLFHTNIGNSLEFCKLVIFVVFSRLDGLRRLRTVIHHIASKKYVYLPIPRTVRGYCQTKKRISMDYTMIETCAYDELQTLVGQLLDRVSASVPVKPPIRRGE